MRTTLLIVALLTTPNLWAATVLPALSELAGGPARVSALVVDLGSRETLAQLSPRTRLTPASVSKLYTTAAALQRWGPTHRFTTRLLTNGQVRDGVLYGDLVFMGAGDPDFDHARLWRLIAQLRQRGITRIDGNLVINQSLFGPVTCLTLDRCEAQARTRHSYDAPLSSAGINFSTVSVSVFPGDNPAEPARLALMPPGMSGFRINGEVDTARAGDPTSIWAWRATKGSGNHVQIAGQVPLRRTHYTVHRSVTRPARYTGRVLRAVASSAGILVNGDTRVTSRPPDDSLRPVASVTSPPLSNQLRNMLAYSNNYMADTLTLNLAAYDEPAPSKPLSLQQAGRKLEALAHRANAEVAGWLPPIPANATPLAIDTGSGLSVSNKLAARDVVALLAYMYNRNATFATFAGMLPVPRFTHSSRLKDDNAAWSTRVAAKTGTLTEPVSVFAYAGYLRLSDGGWGAFAVLVNGRRTEVPVPSGKSIDAIQKDIQALLRRH